jgi:prepilin-type N-terminal cleavage/methylation domain-containing protein
LHFPKSVDDARDLKDKNAGELGLVKRTSFDGTIHLDARLISARCTGQPGIQEAHKLTGTLRSGDELQVDTVVKLSDDARAKIAENLGHKTLDKANGMIIEIRLTWMDDDGAEMTRTMYAPVNVHTRDWWYWWGLTFTLIEVMIALVLVGIAGRWAYRNGYLKAPTWHGIRKPSAKKQKKDADYAAPAVEDGLTGIAED